MKFKALFPRCLNLPGVPLTFVGRRCEFYMGRDPQTNKYAAYVYSQDRKESFLLAANFGPPAHDFMARYNKLLTQPPLSAPLAGTPIAVRGPADGQPVQWFLTAGTNNNPVPANVQGYYAAMATPVGYDASLYKPPYNFSGAAPGIHAPDNSRLVYGQLVYDPLTFVINPNFPTDTFEPPSGYTPIKPICWKNKQMNCAACHLSDPPHLHVFYTQKGRGTPCKSAAPAQ
ncbi:MAG TPA: hypothetical protein VMS31_22655 [Pyrinomonadaceae bacterium]|nr:hypothetical protein [Pyrinomonadaceae bacterium]